MPAIIPPGAAFVTQSIYTLGIAEGSQTTLLSIGAQMSSLLSDYLIRAVPKSSIPKSVVWQIPFVNDPRLNQEIDFRFARLNCMTNAYAELWEQACWRNPELMVWSRELPWRSPSDLGIGSKAWNPQVPLRKAAERRQALLEIDACVALMRGVAVDELCAIYRTQFPVLLGYDRDQYFYDKNGRLVPSPIVAAWRRRGNKLADEERTATNRAGNTYTYELPFVTFDREADMRQAYAHFERLLKDRS